MKTEGLIWKEIICVFFLKICLWEVDLGQRKNGEEDSFIKKMVVDWIELKTSLRLHKNEQVMAEWKKVGKEISNFSVSARF